MDNHVHFWNLKTDMVEQLSVKHKLLLSLEHSVNLGYHINVAVPRNLNMKISDLPAEFIQVFLDFYSGMLKKKSD